jgi:transposase
MHTARPTTHRSRSPQPVPARAVPPVSADWDPWHEQLSDASVLPAQFFSPQTSLYTGRPVAALLRAVLEDALTCFQKQFVTEGRRVQRMAREAALRVFLEYPNVPLDTNHLEREIRAIALDRRNWLFCWTEVGAQYVGIVQSLLAACRLQGIDPYDYLVDVLQRIDTHPAFDVHLLTPRLWKQHFADTPLRSDLDRFRQ